MKFLIGFLSFSLFFIHTSHASKIRRRPVVNCQVQGYEASPHIAPDYLKKFSARQRIITANWEACFKQATLFTHKYPSQVPAKTSVLSSVFGSPNNYRVFKWIYKEADGSFRSGIISKYSDQHIDFPEEGSIVFDQGGTLLNIDTSRIESN